MPLRRFLRPTGPFGVLSVPWLWRALCTSQPGLLVQRTRRKMACESGSERLPKTTKRSPAYYSTKGNARGLYFLSALVWFRFI